MDDEQQRYENEQNLKHKRIAFGVLALLLLCAVVLGARYWGRDFPSIGKAAAPTDAREDALAMTCHAFPLDLTTYYPAPVTPVDTPIGVILLCRDIAAGEVLQVRITHNSEIKEIDVTLRETETPWNVSNGDLGFVEAGLYAVEYTYKGKLIARTYVEVL